VIYLNDLNVNVANVVDVLVSSGHCVVVHFPRVGTF